MEMPTEHRNPTPSERDERIKIDLDPETALRGLLAVDPNDDSPTCYECGKPGAHSVSVPVLAGPGSRMTVVVCDEHLSEVADTPGVIVVSPDH